MLRHLLLVCFFALSALAFSQDSANNTSDQPLTDQMHPIFTWLTPTNSRFQVSRGPSMSFQIRTTIIILGSSHLDKPVNPEQPDKQEQITPDPGKPDRPEKTQQELSKPTPEEIEQGYHDLPYHTTGVKVATPLALKVTTCGVSMPKGWSGDSNCGRLSWTDGEFVVQPGKALDLELDRSDIVGATLNGAPLFVVRNRSGRTEIKTSRRLFAGSFQLVIQSAKAEKYTLSVGGARPTPAQIAPESICQRPAPSRSLAYRLLFMNLGA